MAHEMSMYPMDEYGKRPTGYGGNSTIANQDEAEILYRTTQMIPTRAEGAQEQEFHGVPNWLSSAR